MIDLESIRKRAEEATPGEWTPEYCDPDYRASRGPKISDSTGESVLGYGDLIEKVNANFIAHARTIIPELCDALEKANAQIESIHKSLDFAETQRQKSKNYTELAINNGLALGRIAVTIQHDFGPLPAPPKGE